jgi:hypothetical protein
MKPVAPPIGDGADHHIRIHAQDTQRHGHLAGEHERLADGHERFADEHGRLEDELIMHLERDQFVAETSRPVPRAALSKGARAGLWTLRVFVVLVSLMVIYTFVDQLH